MCEALSNVGATPLTVLNGGQQGSDSRMREGLLDAATCFNERSSDIYTVINRSISGNITLVWHQQLDWKSIACIEHWKSPSSFISVEAKETSFPIWFDVCSQQPRQMPRIFSLLMSCCRDWLWRYGLLHCGYVCEHDANRKVATTWPGRLGWLPVCDGRSIFL